MTLAPEIQQRVERWTKPPFDPETVAEIRRLVDDGNEKELTERFHKELEFGTGGLRGLMGAGLNRMNRYTVGRATQGLANYVRKTAPGTEERPACAVVAYDSRRRSREFARRTACVLAANAVKVYLFEDLRPTPELSFAVRMLGATTGVVVTASHNPKEYNGYKVYWSDGGQVVPPQDTGIIEEVQAIQDFDAVRALDYDDAVAKGLVVLIGEKVDNAFLEAILPLSMQPHVCREVGAGMPIVYTPLHGSGVDLVPKALQRWGFSQVSLCESQAEPDGDFPNAPSPNPEEKEALAAAIRDAAERDADLVLATDPDCDRVGLAFKSGRDYMLLTGNQIASLIVEYVLAAHAEMGSLLPEAGVCKTIVTTDLVRRIAEHYGARCDDVLTGFKYIGEKIGQWEKTGEAVYLAGGEESYGYLVGTHARDKDAVVAACMIAEIAAVAKAQGQTLAQRLDDVYAAHGVFKESLASRTIPGAEGHETILRIMNALRETPPETLLGAPVVRVTDYQKNEVRDLKTGQPLGETGLPKSDVLVFETEDGSKVTARPSGTEPKIKFYFSVSDVENLPIRDSAELQKRKQAADARNKALRDEFLALVDRIAKG